MEELKKYYEAKLTDFEKLHKSWVASNKRLNGLYLAKTQIKSEGDTYVDYAFEMLSEAQKKERARNDRLCNEVNFTADFLKELENYLCDNFNVELNGVIEIRGY